MYRDARNTAKRSKSKKLFYRDARYAAGRNQSGVALFYRGARITANRQMRFEPPKSVEFLYRGAMADCESPKSAAKR